ncbi:hypothetical protein [Blastococcus deserti]|uniref:Secreted protein n=1 Tax=Blastococcus deserti TaxID=2259033 RepID=A0ABW4X5G4_9ACTN
MSIRPSLHRGRAAAVTGVATLLLVGSGGIATADPPSLNVDPCAAKIAAAGTWPGTIDDDGHRVVSDGFDSYLSRQPECTADLTDR